MVRMTSITLVSLLLGWASESWLSVAFVPWVFYVIAYINGSFYSIQEAWGTLKQRQFDVNLLMIAAALGAAVINQPLEGATLMFLFSLSQTLETYAMGRTHASIRALIDMTPKTARVIQEDNTHHGANSHNIAEREIPVDDVAIGDIVRVRPGEQIPTDGVVVRGASAVNEASITGESMPIEKQTDSQVFAGTINGQGSLDIRVTTANKDSTLAHIVKIVSEARQQKARSQHFTDKVIGQYYAYTVAAITLLAVIIPLLFLGWDTRTTVYRAITLMVGASPCALVISIPAAILSALASASWNGVLFKGGKPLESASRVKVVAFDKTGTLTTGQLGVAAIIPLPLDGQETWDTLPAPGEQLTQAQARVLALAAAVEQFSEHPLAQAIVTQAQQQQVMLASAESFESLTGFGVRALIDNQQVQVGRPSLFTPVQDETLAPSAMDAIIAQEQKGHTVILVGTADEVWGILSLADTIRPESADIVAGLKQAGVCCVMLLTGDNRYAAEHLAGQVGIDEVYAELTPQQKVETIRQIQADKGQVAMIGDGINDAPALATATLGVAMGAAGTDVAMESADVVLMSDDLSRLPGTLRLARRTRQIVRQNLVFAFSMMLVLVVLALGGFLPLTIATIAHEGSTLLVVANGLRLLASWR
jgi:Cd2+/Zn2+-exporting ATPase